MMKEKDAKAMSALRAHAAKPAKQAHGFKKGGPTTDDRMKLGKNLSRAANQKTG
jgi:hypothetical protein